MRSTILAVQPAVPGLDVRLEEAGNVVVLTNRTGREVVVRGYEGEPYLRVGPAGVFENRHSPTRDLNAGTDEAPPASAGHGAPVEWVRRSAGITARWHDERTEAGSGPGGAARTAPWSLPLTVADQDVIVVGQRTRVPGPPAWPGVGAAVALAAAVFALGKRRPRGWSTALAVALGAAVLLDVVRAAGGFAARVAETLPDRAFDELFFPALGWAAAVLALRRLLRRPGDPPLAALFAAIPLLVFGGLSDLSVLWRSQLVFAYPAWLARAAAVSALGVGGGLVVLFVVELARPVQVASRPAAAGARV